MASPAVHRRPWSRPLVVHAVVAVVVVVLAVVLPAVGAGAPGEVAVLAALLLGLPWSAVALLVPVPDGRAGDVVSLALFAGPALLNVAVLALLRARRRTPSPAPGSSAPRVGRAGRRGLPLLVVLCALLGAATWGAWLGWDTSTYTVTPVDPADSGVRGPYTPAQVVACAVTVGAVVAALSVRWNPLAVAGGVTLGFWAAWTASAAAGDDSGLFVVGSALLLFGLVAGTSLAAALGHGVRVVLAHR